MPWLFIYLYCHYTVPNEEYPLPHLKAGPMTKNVLLIDDDPDDAMFFSQALTELSFPTNFRYVGNGIETVPELLKNNGYSPDIIFLDINMPRINGWECLRELKSLVELHCIPVVMYSTADIEHEGMAPSDVGAAAFMMKPSSFAELKTRLSNLIGTFASA
jgi:CheY-like chemotaxis protein